MSHYGGRTHEEVLGRGAGPSGGRGRGENVRKSFHCGFSGKEQMRQDKWV